MTQLQPNIVVIDGIYQNGSHTGTVCTQCIRKDLIAYQGAIPGLQTMLS